MISKFSLASAIVLLSLQPAFAQTEAVSTSSDWLNWRGPSQNGSSVQTGLPQALSPKELQWKTPLPGTGCSTPIVVGGAV